MNRDIVVGIVGTAVLVAAMVGVFTYERNSAGPAAPGPGDGGAAGNVTVPDATGTTGVGRTTEQKVVVNATSAASVTFTLTWKASQGKDTLQLAVKPPAGSAIVVNATPRSDSGRIELVVGVPAGVSPKGEWTASVTVASAAPGLPLTPPVSPPVTPPAGTDAAVSWTLATKLA